MSEEDKQETKETKVDEEKVDPITARMIELLKADSFLKKHKKQVTIPASSIHTLNAQYLTPEELQEVTERPIGTAKLTKAQIELRCKIADEWSARILQMHDELQGPKFAAIRLIYKVYPLSGFYVTKKKPHIPKRAFGAMDMAVGSHRLHVVSALHNGFMSTTAGGTAISDLKRVKYWGKTSRKVINRNEYPGVFLDPLGFIIPMWQYAPDE